MMPQPREACDARAAFDRVAERAKGGKVVLRVAGS